MGIEGESPIGNAHSNVGTGIVPYVSDSTVQRALDLLQNFPGVFCIGVPPSHISHSIVSLHTEPEDSIFRDFVGKASWYQKDLYDYYSWRAAQLLAQDIALPTKEDIGDIWQKVFVSGETKVYSTDGKLGRKGLPGVFQLGNGMIYEKGEKLIFWLNDGSIAVLSTTGYKIVTGKNTEYALATILTLKYTH